MKEERGERPSRRKCRFCIERDLKLDYKDAKALRYFVSDRGKISPPRMNGLCAYHQRRLAKAIKRARIMGLAAFSVSQREPV